MKRVIFAVVAAAALMLGGLAMAPAANATDDHNYCPDPPFMNTILGSPGEDVLNGTRCDDRIVAFGSNDVLRGKGGEDRLRGGRGADRLNGVETFGFAQADVLNGGRGFDTCVIDFLDIALRCENVIEVDPL